MAEASKRSVLSVLTKGRLEDLAREFGVPVPGTATKDAQVAVLADSALDLGSVLGRLHAKCIVVDYRRALVTSANFTSRGQERNVEVGVLVESEKFARELVHQWRNAAEAGVFRRSGHE